MNHQRELKRYLSSENVTRELEDFYELIDSDFSYSVFDFLQQIFYFLLFNVDLLRSRLHFQLSQLTWFAVNNVLLLSFWWSHYSFGRCHA